MQKERERERERERRPTTNGRLGGPIVRQIERETDGQTHKIGRQAGRQVQ